MKSLLVLVLFGFVAGSVRSSLTDDLLSAGDWSEEDGLETDDTDSGSEWDSDEIEGEFSRGIVDKAKHQVAKLAKEIPVLKSCKCDDKQCGCCLVFMTKEKNISSCITVESITEKKGIQITMQIHNTKKELFITEKTYCFDFQTGMIFACAKPYGTTVNTEGIRSCLQISLKLSNFKVVSADLNCFRIAKGKFTLEEPKKEERPKKGMLNRIVSKLTKTKDKKDTENKA